MTAFSQVAVALSPESARTLTDQVKADAAQLWRKIVWLHEGGAHTALGYTSWGAYCASEFGLGQSRAYQLLDAGRTLAALDSTVVDWRPANEAQARELAPLLRDEGEDAVLGVVRDLQSTYGDKVTAEKIRDVVSDRLRSEQRVAHIGSSASEEWYTPSAYVEAARRVLGGIDLDPASNETANEVVRADRFYTAQDDGLAQPWAGRVWLNPPYGGKCAPFVAKLQDEYEAGRVTAAILLVSAYSTDTIWFQPLYDHVLCFTNHRIDFYSPDGRGGSSNHGSVFAYLGPDAATFAAEFSTFGSILHRFEERAA